MSSEDALKDLYRSAFAWTEGGVVKQVKSQDLLTQALELSRGAGLPYYCLDWRVGFTNSEFQLTAFFQNPTLIFGADAEEGDLRTRVLNRCVVPMLNEEQAREFEAYRALSFQEQQAAREPVSSFADCRPSHVYWAKVLTEREDPSQELSQGNPWRGFASRLGVFWELQAESGPYPADPAKLQASVEEFNTLFREWVMERL